MTTGELDSGEIRMINSKIKYNKKLLKIAEESGDEELIKKYTYNIELHEKQLKELK